MTEIFLPLPDVPGGLPAILTLPNSAKGVIIFAHGSGSSRHSPRNRAIAKALQARGFATVLFDLLIPEEADDRANVFDIDLLGRRVSGAIDCIKARQDMQSLPLGLFGASTGAAAALSAAANDPTSVDAVVSRGGRPDLAKEKLARVRCPTLLIVGGADHDAVRLNRDALDRLTCRKSLRLVPGATHLFVEAGAMEAVAELAGAWFTETLGPQG